MNPIRPHNPLNLPARQTTVCNISTTERFPVERADNAKRVPPTRPPYTVKPVERPANADQPNKALQDDLRERLAQRPATPTPRNVADRVARGASTYEPGPREGIGRGEPPPGGVKVR